MSNRLERQPRPKPCVSGNNAVETSFSPLAVLEEYRRNHPELFVDIPEESFEIRVSPCAKLIGPNGNSKK